MADDFVIVTRNVSKGKFGNEPGPTKYLFVPDEAFPEPSQAVSRTDWIKSVLEDSKSGQDPDTDEPIGDILFYVHGYRNSQETVIRRHRLLSSDLKEAGYGGTVVSFDWPSGQLAIAYLEDRSDAKATAIRLVQDGIAPFARMQRQDCQINVHLLGHSMGSFVIREAFDDADDRRSLAAKSWTVSQTVFIGADISAASLSEGDSKSSSLFRRTVRLTNYSSRFDSALKLSNVKRIGVAPRVGRVGLPSDAPSKAIDVDCSKFWQTLDEDDETSIGSFAHSWHIGNKTFAKDLLTTLQGDLDRSAFPTRAALDVNRFELKAAE